MENTEKRKYYQNELSKIRSKLVFNNEFLDRKPSDKFKIRSLLVENDLLSKRKLQIETDLGSL